MSEEQQPQQQLTPDVTAPLVAQQLPCPLCEKPPAGQMIRVLQPTPNGEVEPRDIHEVCALQQAIRNLQQHLTIRENLICALVWKLRGHVRIHQREVDQALLETGAKFKSEQDAGGFITITAGEPNRIVPGSQIPPTPRG